jgi:glycosyltransferase involved in cell wall biosynthesis
MRIGYFTTLFPYAESFQDSAFSRLYPIGGAEVAAYHEARSMVKLGHEVIVFTTSINSKSHIEEFEGIKIYRYGTNFKIEKAFFSFDLQFKSTKQHVDVVLLHFATPPGNLAGWYYAKVRKKPLVVIYHGDVDPSYGKLIRRVGLSLFDTFAVPRILSSAKVIISNSEHYTNKSRFLTKYRGKVVVIPRGLNLEEIEVPYTKNECRSRLSLSMDDRVILFVGNLINYKSPDLLIESLPLVIKKVPEAKLVLVGDGPMRQDMERLAQKLGIADRVKFTGILLGNLKALYYNAADVFALPSTGRTESFGIVLLEAAAAGLPIVVSSLDAFRAFIEDGYNGIITRAGDINSLAEAITLPLSQPALRRKMGGNALSKVKDYSWEKIAKMTESVYEMAGTDA